MLGKEFIDHVAKFQVTNYAGMEDFADKFSFIGSVVVISLCCFIISVKSYLLKPIACYISTEVGGTNLLNYVENYCWVQGTVPISYSGKMPTNEKEWDDLDNKKILYYQWVPFVLGIQCCLFYLPRVIWQIICYNRTGSDLESLIKNSVDAVHKSGSARDGCVDNVATDIEYLLFQKQRRALLRNHRPIFSRKQTMRFDSSSMADRSMDSTYYSKSGGFQGSHIAASYIVVKVLYLINAVGQLFLMQTFLGFGRENGDEVVSNAPFGISVLDNMVQGHDWQMTQIFPRVGFCFVQMKHLGVRTNGVTAQCALPVNMLNEKIYVFLWWWILLAVILTTVSLGLWLVRFCSGNREADYVLKYIKLNDDSQSRFDERDAHMFALQFLSKDGMFLVRMVRLNAGDVIASAVVNNLFNRYLDRIEKKTNHPLSNFALPTTGNVGMLEKGGGGETAVRNRGAAEYPPATAPVLPKESLYPPTSMVGSDDEKPLKGGTIV